MGRCNKHALSQKTCQKHRSIVELSGEKRRDVTMSAAEDYCISTFIHFYESSFFETFFYISKTRKMSKNFTLLLAATLVAAACAQAQDTSYNQLDEVIVTANKYPQKQNTTGKVVSVITKDIIEKSTGKTVAQLLNEQAGITVNGALNNLGSVQTIYMRGASSGRALILVDGIPVNDPSMINNEFDLNFISLNDVEQIEICKGAQSTLYGSDAVAGVINIITVNKDIKKAFNAKATLTGGSYNTFKGNAQVYGKVDKLTYSVRYAKLYTDGFSSAYDSSGKGGFDKDGYKSDAISALLQYQVNNELSIKAFAQSNQYKSDIDGGGFYDDKDYTIHHKNFLAGVGMVYKTDWVTLTGNVQYNELHRNFLNDSTDGSGYAKNKFEGKTYFGELYASSNLGSGFTILAGADFRTGRMNSSYMSVSIFGPYESTFPDTSNWQTSLYSSINYNAPNGKLNVELGGRLNVHSLYGNNNTYTFNPSYAFTKNIRAFGSIATGFKAPSLYQLYDAFSGNRNLNPEKSTNYEAGLQYTAGKAFSVRGSYFYRNIKNGIDYNNITYQYFNYVKQIVRGIEVELTAHPTKALTITANYTYIVPSETTQERTTFSKDTTYKYLLRRPKNSINATIGYQVTKGLYVSASGKYVTKRFDAGGYMVPDVKLDSYFLLSAYAEYKFTKTLKLFADAQNITDKRFFDVYGYNSIPSLISGGFTVNF